MAGKTPEKMTDTTDVSTTELAMILGVTARRVQQMAQDGTLPTVQRGRFLLAESVQRYITFLSKGESSEEDKRNEKIKSTAEATLKASKARIAKMEADELSGKMHRSEDVAAMTEDLIFSIRSMLVALPGRMAVDVAAASSAAEAAEIIRKEVYSVMKELANYRYDHKKYEERVRERRDWDALRSDDDDG